MSDLDEELYGLIADDDSDIEMNELEKEQKLAEKAEKKQIKEDKRKLAEMLKNRGKKQKSDDFDDVFSEEDGSSDDFMVQDEDVVYKMRDKRERSEIKPPDLSQIKSLQLTRDILTKILYRKDFEDIVIGAFIRVPARDSLYRVYEIIDVIDYKMYDLTPSIKTDKSLSVRYGKDTNRIYMDTVSNKSFEIDEWERWLKKMKKDIMGNPQQVRYMQEEEILNKVDVLKDKLNQTITEEELYFMINERKKIVGENATVMKLNLKRQLAAAMSQKNEEQVTSIRAQLIKLGEKSSPVDSKPIFQTTTTSNFKIPKIDLNAILGDTPDNLDAIDVDELIK